MKVRYQHGYYPEEELDVIEIVSHHENGLSSHTLRCSNGDVFEATDFSYASGCLLRASIPENW